MKGTIIALLLLVVNINLGVIAVHLYKLESVGQEANIKGTELVEILEITNKRLRQLGR